MKNLNWISRLIQSTVLIALLFTSAYSEAKVNMAKKNQPKHANKVKAAKKHAESKLKKSSEKKHAQAGNKKKSSKSEVKKLAKAELKHSKRSPASVNKKKKH